MSRNESSIARPRGIKRERKRTGKESTRAKAIPPTVLVSTSGTRYTTYPSTKRAAKSSTVRVRLEIGSGVGRAVTSGSPFGPWGSRFRRPGFVGSSTSLRLSSGMGTIFPSVRGFLSGARCMYQVHALLPPPLCPENDRARPSLTGYATHPAYSNPFIYVALSYYQASSVSKHRWLAARVVSQEGVLIRRRCR